MSDVVHKPAKVSREGIVLIKSFEGFRPRATRRDDDRWVIGYGHTLSAREGLTVSEADAELLLQYDLIPVVKAVVEETRAPLNQHQFDALASFAFSVGADRFRTSDVLERLNAGAPAEAVAALAAWDDTGATQKPTRRRSVEHALFNAPPGAPVALADLLAAPLPSPFAEVEAAPPAAVADETVVAALLDQDVAPFPNASDDAVQPTPIPESAASAPVAANDVDQPQAEPTNPAVDLEGEQAAPSADTNAALRQAVRARAKKKGAWAETATFLLMGALGMLAFGTAMAAFLRASTTRGGDAAMIGWVLIAIAVACIGVSGYNLYQRWGRADRS